MIRIPYNKFTLSLLSALYKEGFIQSFSVTTNTFLKKEINIFLRYYYNKSPIKSLKIISTPSRIKYLNYNALTKLSLKKNILFLSTSLGVLTASECRKRKIGGTLFFIC
jgi:ribosomal protein S8